MRRRRFPSNSILSLHSVSCFCRASSFLAVASGFAALATLKASTSIRMVIISTLRSTRASRSLHVGTAHAAGAARRPARAHRDELALPLGPASLLGLPA